MSKKRYFFVLAAFALFGIVLAACAPAPPPEATPIPPAPTPIPPTPAPSLIVGAIYVGAITDAGYNQAQHDGLVELKQNLPFIQILEAENIAESAEAERVMESMIQQGAKLIFATSFGHLEPALAVAERHPDVTFMHAGGYLLADNFGTYFGTPQVYWYSMGVAAGKMTQTNKLGFIGGFPIGFALGNINGFHLGARSVNPDVETFVVFTASWLDRAKEAEATNALLDQGVDVVAMHVDSPITIIQTAEARGAYSIGFQSLAAQQFAPRGWLTGLGFTWGGMMTDTAQQVIDGTWEPAHLRKGIADGYMAVAPFGAAVPDDVQQLVLDTVVAIDGGELNPFCGPILDQDGVVRIAEGECWGNEKMGDFDWFAQGIIGQPK